MTLTEFLTARLDEDEGLARAAAGGSPTETDFVIAQYLGRFDPARALREVDAKRKILAEVVPEIKGMDQQIISEWGTSQDVPDAHLPLLKIMAAVYADHPDYQEEWQ